MRAYSQQAVAVGGGSSCFIAAAMSNGYVRLYSSMGVAKHLFSLDGPVVAMTARDGILFIAYHAGPGMDETQNLAYESIRVRALLCSSCISHCLSTDRYLLFDVTNRKTIKKDRLPLTPVGDTTVKGLSQLTLCVRLIATGEHIDVAWV